MGKIRFGAVKNFNNLDISTKLLFYVMLKAGDGAEIELSKQTLSEELVISRQTAGKHLITFATCNILKYKYSGKLRLNPDFYYKGKPEELEKVKNEYLTFKSDI